MKLFIVLSVFAVMSCQAQLPSRNALPASRPADFRLSYHVDGGMRYYSESFAVTADSCVYDLVDEGRKTHQVFKLSAAQLDQLYSLLRRNHFDEITAAVEGRVYDRGGISMRADWEKGQRQIAVSDAQGSFVDKRWEADWSAICNYVAGLTRDK
ncbi:MAG: hypothetical protein U0X40_03415 [Ferruginibacter sp.]